MYGTWPSPLSIFILSIEIGCWMYASERQTARLRLAFMQSVLSQEIGAFDTDLTTVEIITDMYGAVNISNQSSVRICGRERLHEGVCRAMRETDCDEQARSIGEGSGHRNVSNCHFLLLESHCMDWSRCHYCGKGQWRGHHRCCSKHSLWSNVSN